MFPPEPARPAQGQPIPDSYIRDLIEWGNDVLGVAKVDRLQWRGERKCIRKLQEAGQIR